MKKSLNLKDKDFGTKFLLFLAVFFLHSIVAFQMKMLHISTDEMGVLSTAAYLVGEDWSGIVQNLSYYGYGHALLYIPVFLITKNPDFRYFIMGIENSVILSLIPVIIYIIIKKYVQLEKKHAVMIAFCIGIFPSYTCYTKWLWYETMLSFLPVLFMLLILSLYKNKRNNASKKILSFILSFLSVYSFAVHGRSLGIIVAILVTVLYIHFRFKEAPVNYLPFFCGYLLGAPCYIYLKNYLTKNLWLLQKGEHLDNTTANIMPALKRIFNMDYFLGNLRIFIGQLYTACMSTYGLLLLFLLILGCYYVSRIRKKRIEAYSNEEEIIFVFSLLLFLCSYLISTVANSGSNLNPNSRGDYPIYIRYFSHVLGLIVFSVLLMFQKSKLVKSYFIISILNLAFISLGTVWKIAPFINSKTTIANIPLMNILPFIGPNPPDYIKHINFVSLSVVTMAIFIVITLLWRFSLSKYIPVLLSIVFIFVYYYNAVYMILPNNRNDYAKIAIPKEIMEQVHWQKPYPKCYYYNPNQKKPWSDSMLQFSLPEFQIENITMEQLEELKLNYNSIIISTEDLVLETFDSSFYRVDDTLLNTGIDFIWIYGEDLKLYVESNSDLDFYMP